MKAKKWLRKKTGGGTKKRFSFSDDEGGYVGSLRGLGYVDSDHNGPFITTKGLLWLGFSCLEIARL